MCSLRQLINTEFECFRFHADSLRNYCLNIYYHNIPGDPIPVQTPAPGPAAFLTSQCAQTKNGWLSLISVWIILLSAGYRIIVVTDRRIIVCKSGRLKVTGFKEVLAELPRSTKLGPPSGIWYRCNTLNEPIYFHKRFHKDIESADAVPSV